MKFRGLCGAKNRVLAAVVILGITAIPAHASGPLPPPDGARRLAPANVVVYNQPPDPNGGILHSSLRDPDGSAADQWVWDGFVFPRDQEIAEIQWRGAYDPARFGSGGPVFDFSVEIFPASPAGPGPDISRPPLVHFEVGSNAGETAAATLGGVKTYAYRFVLPAPFQAAAGAKYWVQIEAHQSGSPDWGLAKATGGDGVYFRRIPGQGANYQLVSGDAAFALIGPGVGPRRCYLPLVIASGD